MTNHVNRRSNSNSWGGDANLLADTTLVIWMGGLYDDRRRLQMHQHTAKTMTKKAPIPTMAAMVY